MSTTNISARSLNVLIGKSMDRWLFVLQNGLATGALRYRSSICKIVISKFLSIFIENRFINKYFVVVFIFVFVSFFEFLSEL